MMYCPSIVGTITACHVNSGTSTKGAQTMSMWSPTRATTTRTARGIKHSTPMTHSRTARALNRTPKWAAPTVLAVRALASPVASLRPRSLMKPNQKYTTKSAPLATPWVDPLGDGNDVAVDVVDGLAPFHQPSRRRRAFLGCCRNVVQQIKFANYHAVQWSHVNLLRCRRGQEPQPGNAP